MGAETLVAPPLGLPPVACPTLGIFGTGDLALVEEQMTGSAAYVKGPWRYEPFEGCGHWLQLEAPDRLNPLLLEFLNP